MGADLFWRFENFLHFRLNLPINTQINLDQNYFRGPEKSIEVSSGGSYVTKQCNGHVTGLLIGNCSRPLEWPVETSLHCESHYAWWLSWNQIWWVIHWITTSSSAALFGGKISALSTVARRAFIHSKFSPLQKTPFEFISTISQCTC